MGRQRVTEGTAGRRRTIVDTQKAEISRLRGWMDKYSRKYRAAKERIAELEHHIHDASRTHREELEKRDRHIQAIENDLRQTKELLAARTTELSGAQSFLSTTDRISEAEVLGIVRDLNENIFQVAAKLTEEWEKFRPDKSSRFKITNEEINCVSQAFGPALVHHALDRDSAAVTFLIQSCLCDFAIQVSSSWRFRKEFRGFRSVYERLSASEGQAISARWRSLAYSHLPKPPSDSVGISELVGETLWITGSFPSIRHSSEFVKAKASNGIATIERIALRLESVFMVDITSGDMYLLFETPSIAFDGARMAREVESDNATIPEGRDKVAGTTEVGVEKSVRAVRGGDQCTRVLLKTKVVIEKDLMPDLQRTKRHEE